MSVKYRNCLLLNIFHANGGLICRDLRQCIKHLLLTAHFVPRKDLATAALPRASWTLCDVTLPPIWSSLNKSVTGKPQSLSVQAWGRRRAAELPAGSVLKKPAGGEREAEQLEVVSFGMCPSVTKSSPVLIWLVNWLQPTVLAVATNYGPSKDNESLPPRTPTVTKVMFWLFTIWEQYMGVSHLTAPITLAVGSHVCIMSCPLRR